MRQVWIHRDIAASGRDVWHTLVTPELWPDWGPSVRDASVDDTHLRLGATGTVTTALGVDLPFEITAFDARRRWAWKVSGFAATDHTVEPIDHDRCRVGFGVPLPAAPYLAVCRVALRRLDELATTPGVAA